VPTSYSLPPGFDGGGQGGGSSCLFDRGLLTFDTDSSVILSKRLRDGINDADFDCSLIEIEGKKLRLPERFPPAVDALDYHRTRVFVG
jgi:hypothetical protein